MRTKPGDAVITTIRLNFATERRFQRVEDEILSKYKSRNSLTSHSNIKKLHVSQI